MEKKLILVRLLTALLLCHDAYFSANFWGYVGDHDVLTATLRRQSILAAFHGQSTIFCSDQWASTVPHLDAFLATLPSTEASLNAPQATLASPEHYFGEQDDSRRTL